MTIMQALIKKIEQAERPPQTQQPTESGAIQLLRDIFNDKRKEVEQ